jgi:hypothetical protein
LLRVARAAFRGDGVFLTEKRKMKHMNIRCRSKFCARDFISQFSKIKSRENQVAGVKSPQGE